MFDEAPERQLAPGDILIHEGGPATEVFNIRKGMLMVSRLGRDGRRQVLSFLFPDNFVGLTASDRYYFTVQAVTPSIVVSRSFRQLEQPGLSERHGSHMVCIGELTALRDLAGVRDFNSALRLGGMR